MDWSSDPMAWPSRYRLAQTAMAAFSTWKGQLRTVKCCQACSMASSSTLANCENNKLEEDTAGSYTHSGRLISPPVRIQEAAVPEAVEPGRVEEPARVFEQGLVGSDAGAGDLQGEGLLQPAGQAGQV